MIPRDPYGPPVGYGRYHTYRFNPDPGMQLAFRAGRGYYQREPPHGSQQRDVSHPISPMVQTVGSSPDYRGGGAMMPEDPGFDPGGVVAWGGYRPFDPNQSIGRTQVHPLLAQLQQNLAQMGPVVRDPGFNRQIPPDFLERIRAALGQRLLGL